MCNILNPLGKKKGTNTWLKDAEVSFKKNAQEGVERAGNMLDVTVNRPFRI